MTYNDFALRVIETVCKTEPAYTDDEKIAFILKLLRFYVEENEPEPAEYDEIPF